jgi:hypothetical protein
MEGGQATVKAKICSVIDFCVKSNKKLFIFFKELMKFMVWKRR